MREIDAVESKLDILGPIVSNETLECFGGCRLCWATSKMGQRFPENWFLKEYEHHYLLPGLGCLEVGYTLFVSKRHRGSAATQSARSLEEIARDLEMLWKDLRKVSPHWLLFEQGRFQGSKVRGGCIDHFHLHLIPTEQRLVGDIARANATNVMLIRRISELQDIRSDETGAYVLLMSGEADGTVLLAKEMPSQVVRRAFMRAKGNETACNWREHPNIEDCFHTAQRFKQAGVTPRCIYFAHAIENIAARSVEAEVEHMRTAVGSLSSKFLVVSMAGVAENCVGWQLGEGIPVHYFIQITEARCLSWCDVVIADVSREGWQYVGSMMEIALAHSRRIPVIAVVGSSSIGQRQWLKATTFAMVGTIDDAVRMLDSVPGKLT